MEITEKKKVIRNTNYYAQFSYIVLIIFLIHIAQRPDNERGGCGNDSADKGSIESGEISNYYVDIAEKTDLIDDDDCVSIKSDGKSDDDLPKVVFKKPLEKTRKV